MEKDRTITLFVNGEEKQFKILFSFHHDERNEDYVLIYDEKSPEDVMLFQYFDDNTLSAVEDEQIYQDAQELLDMYDQENLEDIETPEV